MSGAWNELSEKIETIIAPANGVIGVCVRDIATGTEIGVRLDEPFPMASVSKTPILVTAYRLSEAGQFDLKERIELTDERRCFGSGILNYFDNGLQPTLRDLMHLMIIVSDNAATDIVLEKAGGAAAVTATMRDLGLTGIRVDRTIRELLTAYFVELHPELEGMRYGQWKEKEAAIPDLKTRSENIPDVREAVNRAAADRDLSTPRDMARLNAMIAKDECASPESCAGIREILERQQLNSRLPRHLPPFQKIPHKTGTLGVGAVVNDAGILYYGGEPAAAIAIFCRDMQDPTQQTEIRMADIARAVWDYYDATGKG